MSTLAALPSTVDDLTAAWLTTALGHPVAEVAVRDIIWGTATKVLVTATYADTTTDHLPANLCVKGGFDERLRGFGVDTAYQTEATFYGSIAAELPIPLPRCYSATFDGDQQQGVLVLDDLAAAGCTFGDPLQPWTADRVAAALDVQAAWHAATFASSAPAITSVGVGSAPVRAAAAVLLDAPHWDAHFAADTAPELPAALQDRERVAGGFRALWARDEAGPVALAHGDAHIGNTYLNAAGHPSFLDWQAVCRAPMFYDVAYFITGALDPADRRAHQEDLVRHYLDALASRGGPRVSFDDAWLDYRRYALHGFLWAVTPPAMQSPERVRAMSDRHTTAIIDLDSLEALLG
jgi:hypothetical protein